MGRSCPGIGTGREQYERTVYRRPSSCGADGSCVQRASIRKIPGIRAFVLEMVPSRPNAAPVSAIVPADESEGVTLVAGKGSYFEIPREGRRYTSLPLFDEVKAICRAVIAGRFEEWVALDGDDVVRSKGVVDLNPAVVVRWRQLSWRACGRKLKTHHAYDPWIAPA